MSVIAGNWKMHHGPTATAAFFSDLTLPPGAADHELLIFPAALSVAAARSCPHRDPLIQLGVQNVHHAPEGAYTGEVSAAMARDAGAAFVLVGHSERRHVFGETDEDVSRKVRAVLDVGLTPVVCVGETLEQRRAGSVREVIIAQLGAVLDVVGDTAARLLIAYEPVWAIGTGETATPDDASAAHETLRSLLDEHLGAARSTRTPILYGGSVKPDNAADLLRASDVDGVLVGGASLDPDAYAAIVAAAG
jgi:triosephosphate isomerase